MAEFPAAGANAAIPLVVDLDETLLTADTLVEGSILLLKRRPLMIARLPG
jgi:hypothetical protein